ncbi:MAG: DUF1593 domain-containing protein [Prevotella sp.]
MKHTILLLLLLPLVSPSVSRAGWRSAFPEHVWREKPRVIVMTDAETDDRCSMVHFLLYTNDMQVDAIIQTNSCFQKRGWSHDPWLAKQLDAYEKVYPNLKAHDAGYPTADYLRQRVYVGDEDPEHVVYDGKRCKTLLPGVTPVVNPASWPDTPGSDRIVEVLLEDDPRPVYIQCWGGTNTAAKAFEKLRREHPADYERAVSKAVLYCIWYQDAGGPYIERHHPLVTILLNHHFSGSWDYGTMTNTTDFVSRYMHNGKNPLGDCYTQTYISEGDTPAFLYSLANGLRAHEDPTYGGWGGRFYKVKGSGRVYRDTGFGQLREWMEPAMHDFQARLQWCVSPSYDDANHKPVIETPMGLDRTVYSGDTVRLAAVVRDPDRVDIEALWATRGEMWSQKGITKEQVAATPDKYRHPWRTGWYQYPSGTYNGDIDLHFGPENESWAWFVAPEVDGEQTVHVIMEAYDMTAPRLTSYARYVITVRPRKPRILVSTDIGGTDPDDNQSMAHLLMMNDRFDIEGLVSSPSFGDGSKEEILRMISLYAADYPVLKSHVPSLLTPDSLRPLCRQGRHGAAPLAGYDRPTEGSQWIVECARREADRPLWILVWGALEDVAQALHDAPDIAGKIRVCWIGGPNKKWGSNAYTYIARNFPDLWMIEDNASYRGFIEKGKDRSFYNDIIKDAGHLGADFGKYYDGALKMGDTPTLLYLMNGNPDCPSQPKWGGQFENIHTSPYRVSNAPSHTDSIPVYGVWELRLRLPSGLRRRSRPEVPFVLEIDRQLWNAAYDGGWAVVRYAPKAPARLDYTIKSDIPSFDGMRGTLHVTPEWPGIPSDTDIPLGRHWYSDIQDSSMYEGQWQGAATVRRWRKDVLHDWAQRWLWLSPR